MPERLLRQYDIGESFTLFCIVRKRELRTSRTGSSYLILEVGDRSGRLSGNIWSDAENLYFNYPEGTIAKIQGAIENYQGRKQIAFKKIRLANEEDNINPSDFLPVSAVEPEKNFLMLRNMAVSVTNPFLNKLLLGFFDDPVMADKMRRAPGGKLWHHDRIGGLIEHTLGICRVCKLLIRLYPNINRDLLIAGAILHDIGKVEEFTYDLFIDYSDRGRLVGHITIGAQMVIQHAALIENFPPDLLDKLTHLVLSHQAEFGSPVKPSTREAFLLHYADQIDSKMDALNSIARELPDGEKWTYVKLLEQWINLEVDNPE